MRVVAKAAAPSGSGAVHARRPSHALRYGVFEHLAASWSVDPGHCRSTYSRGGRTGACPRGPRGDERRSLGQPDPEERKYTMALFTKPFRSYFQETCVGLWLLLAVGVLRFLL